MSIFKKKAPSEEIPEIPVLPEFPPVSFNPPRPAGLPLSLGDARDIDNREAIKSALDSSEKISGDSGAVSSPSENFQIPPISSPPRNAPFSSLPSAPLPSAKLLPEPPKYESRQQVFSNSVPMPPIKESLPINPFVNPENSKVQEITPTVEDKTVKRDANESIFVRIDKFNSAKRDVESIERDLRQITDVIEKVTEIKLKEDEEITEINKTLEEIKNRINRIDTEVFNRI